MAAGKARRWRIFLVDLRLRSNAASRQKTKSDCKCYFLTAPEWSLAQVPRGRLNIVSGSAFTETAQHPFLLHYHKSVVLCPNAAPVRPLCKRGADLAGRPLPDPCGSPAAFPRARGARRAGEKENQGATLSPGSCHGRRLRRFQKPGINGLLQFGPTRLRSVQVSTSQYK